MFIIITYDVNTEDKAGRRRLRRVAKLCQNFGQRVQFSVFECVLEEKDFLKLKADLASVIDEEKDSIRIYFINSADRQKIINFGSKIPRDFEAPLIL